MNSTRTLQLLESVKLRTLFDHPEESRLEASGICHVGDHFYVIFDNLADIACVGGLNPLGSGGTQWFSNNRPATGFEDIAYDPAEQHFYVLLEAVRTKGDKFQPMVEEYDAAFNFLARHEVDFEVEHQNKGFEGIAHIHRGGVAYLLLLCEGNKCKGGEAGRKAGGGRIHVFRRGKKSWKPVAKLKLPAWLTFHDYAALDIYEEWVMVVSQESAALWVGRMTKDGVPLEGEGQVFAFPCDADGETLFCNVEGAVWAGDRTIVAVSDRMKKGEQADRCAQHDQSIHLFRIPE